MKTSGKEFFTRNGVVFALAIFCCLLWGSAAPCIKTGYRLFRIASDDTASQLLFAGIRFTISGMLTIAAGSLLNHRFLIPSKGNLLPVLELSMVQTVIQYFFFYVALANTTGVKGSIIQGANAFIALLTASLIFRLEKLTFQKIIGCFIGFAGVVIINLAGNSMDMSFQLKGEGFILLSTTAYAFSSILIKQFSKKELPYTLSGYQFFLGGIILSICGRLMGGKLGGFSVPSLLLLLYLSFVSATAYTIWAILLKYNPVGKITIFTFATPIFGVILSAIILNESQQAFGIAGLVSLILISIGIILVNKAKG